MASGESEEAKESVTPVKRSKTVDPDQETPTYYDSEPSSQPPNYTQPKSKTRTKSAPSSVPHAEHRGSGVPLATLSVFLADPGPEPEKVKRSLSKRWKDWRNRKPDDEPINRYAWARGPNGSSAQWNVFGSTVSGRSRR